MIQNKMLQVNSNERASCETIWRCIDEMYQNCLLDDDYAASSNPWRIDRAAVPHPIALEQLDISKEVEQLLREKLPQRHLRSPGKWPRRITPTRTERRSDEPGESF
jgi:hypothetical protein